MKCSDCALFMEENGSEGNHICFLCTGTFVTSEEMNSNICKYTGESITDEYASRKFWLDPIDYFHSKIDDIQEILNFANSIKSQNQTISERIVVMLYSQLVTSIEVYLSEKFKQGLQSKKGFENFIKKYSWPKKYTPSELYGNMEDVVKNEIESINFQNFYVSGKVFKIAFDVDILNFPEDIKKNIAKILRFRHALVHQDEIWENGSFVKISSEQILADIEVSVKFIQLINREFEKNIGIPSEIKMTRVKIDELDEREIKSCDECPLGSRFDENTVTCFEGAYDGIGFGIDKIEWKNLLCGGKTFKEAMHQRKLLGENALFGHIHMIPKKEQ